MDLVYDLTHGSHAARYHRDAGSTPRKSLAHCSICWGAKLLAVMTILLASIAASRSMLLEGEDLRSTSGALASTTATGAVRSGNLRKRWAWDEAQAVGLESELLFHSPSDLCGGRLRAHRVSGPDMDE